MREIIFKYHKWLIYLTEENEHIFKNRELGKEYEWEFHRRVNTKDKQMWKANEHCDYLIHNQRNAKLHEMPLCVSHMAEFAACTDTQCEPGWTGAGTSGLLVGVQYSAGFIFKGKVRQYFLTEKKSAYPLI